jgi:hypothetical protein
LCKTAASIAEQKSQLFSEISTDRADITPANLKIDCDRTLVEHLAQCPKCQQDAAA